MAPAKLPAKPNLELTGSQPVKLTAAVLISPSGGDVYRLQAKPFVGSKTDGGALGNVGPQPKRK